MHRCDHTANTIGFVSLSTCQECGPMWTDKAGNRIDPAEGLAAAYGQFELVTVLPSIASPGGQTLVYRVPRRYRARLDVLTVGEWLEIYPALYASRDETNLLLAPSDPVLSRNLLALG